MRTPTCPQRLLGLLASQAPLSLPGRSASPPPCWVLQLWSVLGRPWPPTRIPPPFPQRLRGHTALWRWSLGDKGPPGAADRAGSLNWLYLRGRGEA